MWVQTEVSGPENNNNQHILIHLSIILPQIWSLLLKSDMGIRNDLDFSHIGAWCNNDNVEKTVFRENNIFSLAVYAIQFITLFY